MKWFPAKRSFSIAAAAVMIAGPAHAAQIVQNLALHQSFGDFTPYDIVGNPFDPATGTLTSITAILSGTYTPSVYDAFGPSPGALTTRFFTNLGAGFPTTVGTQIIAPTGNCASSQTGGNCTYTGMPVDFSISPVVTLPLSTFISATPGPADLAYFGFTSYVPGAGGGGSDDTAFTGNLQLTYDYSVPEPTGFALLLSGLAALFYRRRAQLRRVALPPGRHPTAW